MGQHLAARRRRQFWRLRRKTPILIPTFLALAGTQFLLFWLQVRSALPGQRLDLDFLYRGGTLLVIAVFFYGLSSVIQFYESYLEYHGLPLPDEAETKPEKRP